MVTPLATPPTTPGPGEAKRLPSPIAAALEGASLAWIDWDLASGRVWFSPGCRLELGLREDELPDDPLAWANRVHPEDRGAAEAAVRALRQHPTDAPRLELRLVHRDGSYRWMSIQGAVVRDDAGHPIRVLAQAVDVTERRQTEEVLLAQMAVLERVATGGPLTEILESLVRLLESQAPEIFGSVLLVDASGRRLRHCAGPRLPASYTAALEGVAIAEGSGSCGTAAYRAAPVVVADIATDPLWKDWRALALAHGLAACWSTPIFDSAQRVLGTFAMYARQPSLPEERHRRWVETATHIAAIAITRDREESSLRASERRLAEAQAQARLGSWELDLATGEIRWSAEMFRIFHRDPALGAPTFAGFAPLIHPDDLDELAEKQRRLQGTSEPLEGELRTHPALGPLRHVRIQSRPILDADGRPVRVTGTVLDVTERKRAELEERERETQRLQAQKLESLGRLAAGVAHDFNNVLTVISAVTELALSGMTPPERIRADLSAIAEATQRGVEITRQLLAFANKQASNPVALDANESVRAVLRMLARLVGEEVAITTRLARAETTILIDPTHLDQVLVNLVTNARDAISGPGTIAIETDVRVLGEADPERPQGVAPGEHVLIRVSDSGSGIDESVRSRIFEPFFTTKPRDVGTGLGLALVAQLVAQHAGVIDVTSAPGRGTCFTLYFPRCQQVAVTREAPLPAPVPTPRGTETVLVAEDDPMLLELVRRALESFGYRVLTATSAAEAQAASDAERGPIALLLTDTVLPTVDGRQLFDELRKQRPDLDVLFMSGYPLDELVRRNILRKEDPFLPKPFTPSKLIARIRQVLGS
ncbi:MAG: PAS domain-containing protein [bacterium]